ncbi:MAG: tyrosine-protein phosphatase [Eubacteriales bacterium]|jgi:protein-tyrosine phosphatase
MNFKFTSIANFRDLGGYRTKTGGRTKYGAFARSDLPKTLTREETDALRAAGYTTVVDLRTPEETIINKNALCGEPGFNYYNLKLDNWLRASFYGPWETAVYYHMLLALTGNVWAIFEVLAEAEGGTIINCYSGKDRTGTVSALLLMIAGVEDSEIVSDYHKTLPNIWPGMSPEELRGHRLVAVAEAMEIFLDMFREKYGDVEHYFSLTGLAPEAIAKIRAKLV